MLFLAAKARKGMLTSIAHGLKALEANCGFYDIKGHSSAFYSWVYARAINSCIVDVLCVDTVLRVSAHL